MANSNFTFTIVVLEMLPESGGSTEPNALHIGLSGYGRDIDTAEKTLNSAIRESELGKRDLVPLHRLRALRRYSKACSLNPPDEVLSAIHTIAGNSDPLPGFFRISVDDAVEFVAHGILEFKKQQAKARKDKRSQKKRSNTAKAVWARRKKERNRVSRDIDAHVFEFEPHSPYLRDVLDGLEGPALQSWAEKELQKQQDRSLQLRLQTVERFGSLSLDLFEYRNWQETRAAAQEAHDEDPNVELEELGFDWEELGLTDVESSFDAWEQENSSDVEEFVQLVFEIIHSHEWHPAWPTSSLQDIARVVLLDEWEDTMASIGPRIWE